MLLSLKFCFCYLFRLLSLQIHHDELQNREELAEKMEEILSVQNQAARQLDDDMKQSLCLGKYMCSAKLG